MDTDKPRFSFQWSPRSVEDVASGQYIGDTIRCTDGRGSELTFTITGSDEAELTECKGVATDGRVTIPSKIPFLFRHEEDELRLSFRVVSIGEKAFYECSSLTRIIIPASVTSIGVSAFSGCKAFAEIVIPASVTEIGDWAFDGCTSLKEIYCLPATPPEVKGFDLGLGKGDVTVYVPRESVERYRFADGWKKYKIRPMQE